jgi:release factor glutamine methyltransferase
MIKDKMSEIYQPAEDSLFLSEFVKKEIKKLKFSKILDMGSGSGIQAQTCIDSGFPEKDLTLIDINSDAIKHLKSKFTNSKIIKSNLFDKLREKSDLIIFNPPYLPNDKFDKKPDTSGGKEGSEIINKFLNEARNHLVVNGEILILTSSLTKGINWLNYNKKLLGKKRIFFEELYIWKLTL